MTAATLADPSSVDEKPDPDTGKLGMWVFLASELLFFGGLFVAYLYGRVHLAAGWAAGSRHTDVVLGSVNTALLLTSSAAVALAVACEEDDRQRRWTAPLLALTAALGVVFLVLKAFEWRTDWLEHLVPGPAFALNVAGAQQFFALYFVMTGLHGLHMVFGIAALAALARARSRHRPWAGARQIEVAALYWHFVDAIWIFLYPLLYLVDRHG